MTIGQRIKSIREEKGIKLCEIKRETGVLSSTVANWERENNIPRIRLIYKVAKMMGVSLDTVAGRTQRKKGIKNSREKTIGQIIVKRMEEKGYTPKRLSEETGIWNSTIYHYINDRREPHLLLLCSIADVLDMSLDDFIPEEWDDNNE